MLIKGQLLKKYELFTDLQLLRERSSEKVYATIPKGIVLDGFEFNVVQN